jgi:hypothetical protein|tara:strand:- start:482 stop:679 length:198 start_codon:yes stop_codon:yes gene_type:complete
MSTLQKLNTPEQEAIRLNLSPRTMAKARSTGQPAIPFIKIGKTVRYNPEAVDQWLAKNTRNDVGV